LRCGLGGGRDSLFGLQLFDALLELVNPFQKIVDECGLLRVRGERLRVLRGNRPAAQTQQSKSSYDFDESARHN
jgi:hypothetical protein